jgi:hypothetical protein
MVDIKITVKAEIVDKKLSCEIGQVIMNVEQIQNIEVLKEIMTRQIMEMVGKAAKKAWLETT